MTGPRPGTGRAPLPTILAFDTSGPWCVGDILQGQEIIASRAVAMVKGQAEALMPLLQSLMDDAGLALPDLSAIGVGTGPGNFTGVRIAVSAARGLALGLGIPAIGVTRFQAEAGPLATGPIAISLRAPRDGVYLQRLIGVTAAGTPQLLPAGEAGDLEPGLPVAGFAASRLGTGTGTGTDTGTRIGTRIGTVRDYDPDDMFDDLGARIARVAAVLLDSPQPRPAPLYVRAADAAPPRDPAPVILP